MSLDAFATCMERVGIAHDCITACLKELPELLASPDGSATGRLVRYRELLEHITGEELPSAAAAARKLEERERARAGERLDTNGVAETMPVIALRSVQALTWC